MVEGRGLGRHSACEHVFVMTHHLALQERAIKLRTEQGLTIDELARQLSISRSTIYHWVRNIPIVRTYRTTDARQRGNRAMQAAFQAKRDAAYDRGVREFADWANSDPRVVVLAARWIRRFATNPVRFAVQYHADQDLKDPRSFWSRLLRVTPSDIRLQRKSNSNQLSGRRWRSPHGVLTVGANDTLFRARLEAWMDLVKKSWL